MKKFALLILLTVSNFGQAAPIASPLVYTKDITGLSETQFRRYRDSDLKSAQENCIDSLQAEISSDVFVWQVKAQFATANGLTNIHCVVAYFANEAAWLGSDLRAFTKAADFLFFEKERFSKFIRLAIEPYFDLSVLNLNPEDRSVSIQSNMTFLSEVETSADGASWIIPASTTVLEKTTLVIPKNPEAGAVWNSPNQTLTLRATNMIIPVEFALGVATSAHQIEGGNHGSDWWSFENTKGKVFDSSTNDSGPDHWNRVDEDTALLQELHAAEYRMSVEWSRLEPQEGQWDFAAADHYKAEIEGLIKAGVEPIITLHHFTIPKWFADHGGWEWTVAPETFARFTRFVYERIAPNVKTWITFNEPLLHILGGYVAGVVPPEKKSGTNLNPMAVPLTGLLKAHAAAYRALHTIASQRQTPVRVGMAHRQDVFVPMKEKNALDRQIAKIAGPLYNWTIPNALATGVLEVKASIAGISLGNFRVEIPEVRDTQDFFGMNSYFRTGLSFSFGKGVVQGAVPGIEDISEMGWEMNPQSLYKVLLDIRDKVPLPILILENGVGDGRDRYRSKYLRDHLAFALLAQEQGAVIQNFLVWSLYDNFEWDQGYTIRLGLYDVDFVSKKRTPRRSARFFRETAMSRVLPLGGLD